MNQIGNLNVSFTNSLLLRKHPSMPLCSFRIQEWCDPFSDNSSVEKTCYGTFALRETCHGWSVDVATAFLNFQSDVMCCFCWITISIIWFRFIWSYDESYVIRFDSMPQDFCWASWVGAFTNHEGMTCPTLGLSLDWLVTKVIIFWHFRDLILAVCSSAMQLGFEAGGHATCDLWFPNTLGLLAVKNHQLLDTVP